MPSMYRHLLLLLLLQAGNIMIMSRAEEDFFKDCPPSRCSKQGPEIRYPFRLESSPQRCGGVRGTGDLSCSGNETILTISSLGTYNVTSIDYTNGIATISNSSWGNCPVRDLTSLYNLTSSSFYYTYRGIFRFFTVLNCSRNFTVDPSDLYFAGPISCFAGRHDFIYAVDEYLSMDKLPRDCTAISRGLIPSTRHSDYFTVKKTALEDFAQSREFPLNWFWDENCFVCENSGGRCGFSWTRNQTICVNHAGSTMTMSQAEEDLFKDCPPSRCSKQGPEIRFPFRLESSPKRCGVRGSGLSCSGNETILTLPSLGTYNVTAIDYTNGITTISSSSWGNCPVRDLTSLHSLTSSSFYYTYERFTVLNCSRNFTVHPSDRYFAGPISCFAGGRGFIYAVDGDSSMDKLPRDCMAISRGLIPWTYNDYTVLQTALEDFVQSRQVPLHWVSLDDNCYWCEDSGGRCGFSWTRNRTICVKKIQHGSHVALITGVSIGMFIILVSAVLVVLYVLKKFDKEKETHLKVERFLATYKAIKPTRYSYSDLKKVTKRFKQKIGQGGFGSVYKGELPNGIPVAVKMLENSRGDGEDFINEVATIGRIHHVNIVRLLGFCSDGTRRALVYEFLPHESLEKFIFWNDRKKTRRSFSIEKLLDIAIGIAQGIEYLHQGCSQRILHFDIKPHNILLDHNFKPKISDFGLAKLCSRDHSIVTMTAARGTMGYIAPEMYFRNFRTVSYKSDVYSFGMLLLEMVSGKKNTDPGFASQNDVYYPEWIYDRLVREDHLEVATEMKWNEEIVKKLVVVALWCIQWSPTDRPSMTRVVQMLMGDLQSLELPPKPFLSTDQYEEGSPLGE